MISFIVCILTFTSTHGQENFTTRYLGIQDGLSNNVVTVIFQDHNGFMWFGTYDGLNRYDGYEFKVFRNIIGDSTSINSNNINKIEEDSTHNLWVGGQRDVSIFNPVTAKFSTPLYTLINGEIKHSLKDNVVEIKVLNKTQTLVGTEHNGLFYFDNTQHGRQVSFSGNDKAVTSFYVSAIEYHPKKNIAYVFIQNQGLYTYNPATHQLTQKNTSIQNANCLKIDSHGDLWLGESNGLHIYNYATNSFSESYTPGKTTVTNLMEDSEGRLWIATDGSGVLLLNKNSKAAVPLASLFANGKQPVNSNAVYALYEDHQHRKWIGTLRGGVNILEPDTETFLKVVYGEGKPDISAVQNFILSFCEADKDHIWIGTDGAGLRYWTRSNHTFENYTESNQDPSSVSDDFITSIIKDARNDIWLSTWFGGINRFNQQSKTFTHYSCFNSRTNSINNHIWFLFKDSKQRIWASAVRNGALYRFNYATNSFEEFDNKLSEIQCIAEDANGDIWCGDYASLIQIDTLYQQHKYYNIGYTVRSVHEDKNRNFWIGTQEGGLLLFNHDDHSFKRFTTQEGLPSNTILRILEDKKSNLWLSTFNGLAKYNNQTKTFTNFSQADGLQSNQFSFNGALELSTGEFLFGGIKGFNIFYPDSISVKTQKRQLFLSGLKINNTPVEDNPGYIKDRKYGPIKKLVVPYNQASLALDFLALDYKEAADLNYAYILKGWDKNWNYVNHTRIANYSRLYEGNYVFEVKVSGPDGIWGNPQQLLEVTILPPWYRAWWAYCIYVVFGAAIIYFYSLYKSRQTKLKYEVQLAHLETQKEKELNEKKIAFFTNVSHEFRTPISLIINPIKDLLNKNADFKERGDLKVIYRNAQRLLRLADQLLLFKKADSESDKLNLVLLDFCKLCEDVFLCFTEQAKSRNITYEFNGASQGIMLEADREKVEIALFNVISNAFKYTPEGGKITLSVEQTATQVNAAVSDTGAGIPDSEGDKLFERFYQLRKPDNKAGFGIGLYLVKHFVEAHQGKVSYKSIPGKGTTFFITLNRPSLKPPATEKPQQSDAVQEYTPKIKGQETHAGKTAKPLPANRSELLNELSEEGTEEPEQVSDGIPADVAHETQSLLIIDDDSELRHYLAMVFSSDYKVYEAATAEEGIKIAHKQLPDLIISDITMKELSGIDLCKILKDDETVSHIPIILLTGTASDELQLEGMQSGADDYIKKPFDKDILQARVQSILKRKNILQSYFYNEITLGKHNYKVSPEYKEFLEKCMAIIEEHLEDEKFNIKTLATEIGMSHSNLYKKIKTVSGQTVSGFIRYVRLKKAAELLINTEYNVNETANTVGFYDVKYFRVQFSKLFGLNPSVYIKKYRKPFHNNQSLEEKFKK